VADRPTILLVGSAGPGEGRGHIARLVTLAEALGERWATVFVQLLRGSPTAAERERLAGAGARPDRGVSPDAVVVDVPRPDDVAGRWAPERLVVFDDSHRLTDPAAVVVQPSLPAWSGRAKVESVLVGYSYAPIRPGLRRLAAAPPGPADPPQIVVCFGGADPDDVTARLAPTIVSLVEPRAGVTVVLGASYEGRFAGAAVRDPGDLDGRLARATLAVLGAGTMKFEAAHLGVPAILVAVADDQPDVGPPFAATGAARYLGDGRLIKPEAIGDAVTALLGDPAVRAEMTRAGRATVDGRGTDRIADAILRLAAGR